MKKITDVIGSKKVRDEVVSKTIDNNWTGLIKTEKNWHLSSFDKRSRIGATSTTKKQKDSEKFELRGEDGSFSYAQAYGENKGNIDLSDVKNPGLIKESKNSLFEVLKANLLVSKTKEEFIKMNLDNKQKFIRIGEKKGLSRDFIKNCGGEEKTIEAISYNKYYIETIKEGEKMIFILANAGREERQEIYSKYIDVYKRLVVLEKNGDRDVGKMLEKIEDLLN